MDRSDFDFSADAQGYMIRYKGQNIGGASIQGKYKGKRPFSQIKDYIERAEEDINQLVSGHGSNYMRCNIIRIDENIKREQEAAATTRFVTKSEVWEAIKDKDWFNRKIYEISVAIDLCLDNGERDAACIIEHIKSKYGSMDKATAAPIVCEEKVDYSVALKKWKGFMQRNIV